MRSSATRTKDEARGLINGVKGQLDSGASLEELAQAYSECPSKAKGGSLGEFGPGQMVKPFDDAARLLDVGGVSDIVETDFGFHLIRRDS